MIYSQYRILCASAFRIKIVARDVVMVAAQGVDPRATLWRYDV